MTAIEKVSSLVFVAGIFAVYTAEIFLGATFALDKLTNAQGRNILLTKPALFVHLLAVTGIMCFLYGFFIEPYRLKVRTITLYTEKLRNTYLRLVHISDLHCSEKVRNEKKSIELINALQADLIVFTGDAVNVPAGLSLFKDTMKSLKAKLGKYAVKGNVDIQSYPDLDLFSRTGFEVLDEQTIKLEKDGESFYISGFSCWFPDSHHYLPKGVPADSFSIFAHHCPDLIEDLKDSNVDLYLAGHTHGGQVAIPIYGALITFSKHGKKYEAGRYNVNNTVLYVNRGLGTEGGSTPKVRFCVRPEITVFDISPKK